MKRSILIVDDDAWIRDSLTDALSRSGNEVRTAENAEAALAALAESPADVVLTDVRMPGMDGLELLRLVKERAPDVAVVLMTAYDDLLTVSTAMREGAADFLVKPLDLHQLRGVVDRVFGDRRARAAAVRAVTSEAEADRADRLIGHDPQMVEIFKVSGGHSISDITLSHVPTGRWIPIWTAGSSSLTGSPTGTASGMRLAWRTAR